MRARDTPEQEQKAQADSKSLMSPLPTAWWQSPYALFGLMTALHLLWLVSFLPTGPRSTAEKIPLVIVLCLGVGGAVSLAPVAWRARCGEIIQPLLHRRGWLTSLLIVGVGIGGGLYGVYQRPLIPDEIYYRAAASMVAEEGVGRFLAEYDRIPWLRSNHPPLVPILYGLPVSVFGENLSLLRLMSVGVCIITCLLTAAVGRALYGRRTGYLATGLLLSCPLVLRVGAAMTTDIFVMGFFTLVMLGTLRLCQTPSYRLAVGIGLGIGAGLLSKYTMVLVYPALLGCILVQGKLRQLLPHVLVVLVISGGMLGIWLGYAFQNGYFAAQTHTLRFYAGKVTQTRGGWQWMFDAVWQRVLPAVGFYNIPLICLGGRQVLQRRSRSDLSLLVWIGAVCLPVVLTLPDPRYFLPAFPALAIAGARGLLGRPQATGRAVLLALVYCAGVLYLAGDWYQMRRLFVR